MSLLLLSDIFQVRHVSDFLLGFFSNLHLYPCFLFIVEMESLSKSQLLLWLSARVSFLDGLSVVV